MLGPALAYLVLSLWTHSPIPDTSFALTDNTFSVPAWQVVATYLSLGGYVAYDRLVKDSPGASVRRGDKFLNLSADRLNALVSGYILFLESRQVEQVNMGFIQVDPSWQIKIGSYWYQSCNAYHGGDFYARAVRYGVSESESERLPAGSSDLGELLEGFLGAPDIYQKVYSAEIDKRGLTQIDGQVSQGWRSGDFYFQSFLAAVWQALQSDETDEPRFNVVLKIADVDIQPDSALLDTGTVMDSLGGGGDNGFAADTTIDLRPLVAVWETLKTRPPISFIEWFKDVPVVSGDRFTFTLSLMGHEHEVDLTPFLTDSRMRAIVKVVFYVMMAMSLVGALL